MSRYLAESEIGTLQGILRIILRRPFTRLFIFLVFEISCALVLLSRFLYPNDEYISFFTDDFFYYVKIAANLVDTGRSTFDGVRDTNGYHPLWLLISAAVYIIFGKSTGFFVSFVILILIFGLFSSLYYLSIGSSIVRNQRVVFASAIYLSTFIVAVSRTGMEVSLAMLVCAILVRRFLNYNLEEQTASQAVVSGLLSAVLLLSRIDAILLPALYVVVSFLIPSRSRLTVVKKSAWLAIGCSPVLLYFAINLLKFDVFLPISGEAKQLKVGLFPSMKGIVSITKFDGYGILFIWPIIMSALVFVIFVLLKRVRVKADQRAIIIAVLLHPLIFYGLLAVRSDWRMWAWYLYPIPLIGAVTLPFVLEYVTNQLLGIRYAKVISAGAALISAVALIGLVPRNPIGMEIYQTAKQLAAFSDKYPGTYAMGDRAGTPGYMMKVPLVQLEGLVEDKSVLDDIRSSRSLNSVLRRLNVDYYVATGEPPETGCYQASEPSEAGPSSPHMIGSFCDPPIKRFQIGTSKVSIFKVR